MKTLDNRILVKTIEQKDQTAGGIYLPNTRQHEPIEHGIVVTVGPGKLLKDGTRTETQLAEGDHVIMYYKHVGTELKIGGVRHRILKETDILVKVEKETE